MYEVTPYKILLPDSMLLSIIPKLKINNIALLISVLIREEERCMEYTAIFNKIM